jgi:hypothetical protein
MSDHPYCGLRGCAGPAGAGLRTLQQGMPVMAKSATKWCLCAGTRAQRTIRPLVVPFGCIVKHPALWIATAIVACLPAAAFRLFAAAGNSPMAEALQTGARLLALTMVFPLDFD